MTSNVLSCPLNHTITYFLITCCEGPVCVGLARHGIRPVHNLADTICDEIGMLIREAVTLSK